MKAILEFNLPEDSAEHLLAIRGSDFHSVCWDLDQDLIGWLKHGYEFKTPEEAIEAVRDRLRQLMEDKDISLDM